MAWLGSTWKGYSYKDDLSIIVVGDLEQETGGRDFERMGPTEGLGRFRSKDVPLAFARSLSCRTK